MAIKNQQLRFSFVLRTAPSETEALSPAAPIEWRNVLTSHNSGLGNLLYFQAVHVSVTKLQLQYKYILVTEPENSN